MNKVAILTKLSTPTLCIQYSIFIIAVVLVINSMVGLSSIIFDSDNTNESDVKIAKEKLKTINKKSAELFVIEQRLPALSGQVKYALEYFQSYGLTVKKVATKNNNQQKIQVQGQLTAIILAVYDLESKKFLAQFNKIVVKKKNAIVDIIIFGDSNE